MSDKPDLAALIGSRICHDLISPIGAIGNGVELLMMEGNAKASPELALIAESVAHANARIRFFRVAFGAAGRDQRISRTEVAAILGAMAQGGRLHVEWQSGQDLPRPEVKLVFLLLQCVESAMAWGGEVTVEESGAGWRIEARAARMRADPTLWSTLGGARTAEDLGAAHVHFALVPRALAAQGRRLTCALGETTISLRF
ncbi:histidine phosphotransferase family protein [Pseudogemmobacter sonorensis]|uniref:histidine phosphotransferase family protein n=1 Tax=Pseudogemmobacter sonorensis TaxID=2989681 RepID=UPI0036C181B0